VVRITHNKRFQQARRKVKILAKEYYNLLKKEEITWDEMKEILHHELAKLKHEVYGITDENIDKNEGWGESGHEARMDIYQTLKNVFHAELKKFPRLT